MHEYGWRQAKFDRLPDNAQRVVIESNHTLAIEVDHVRGMASSVRDPRSVTERTIDSLVLMVAFLNRGGRYPGWANADGARTPLSRAQARCIAHGWLSGDGELRIMQAGVDQVNLMRTKGASGQ